MDKGYYSIDDLMERYGLGEPAIRDALREGVLPSLRLGKRFVVPAETLIAFERRLGDDWAQTVFDLNGMGVSQ